MKGLNAMVAKGVSTRDSVKPEPSPLAGDFTRGCAATEGTMPSAPGTKSDFDRMRS